MAVRYGTSVAVIAAAAALQKVLWNVIPPSPHLFFYPAILVLAGAAGFGPALLGVALSLPVLLYWFLPPYGSFAVRRPDDMVDLAIFGVLSVILSALIERVTRSERKARIAIEAATVPTALLASDGRVLYANPALFRALGHLPDEIAGKTLQDLVHSEDSRQFRLTFSELEEKREVTFTTRFGSKRGPIVHGEGTISHIHRSADGGYLAQFVDVTRRRAAEAERERVMAQLRAVVDECPVALVILRDGGRVIESNSEAMALYGRAMPPSLDDLPFDAILDKDGRPVRRDQWPSARALRGERVSGVELQRRRLDGRVVHLLVNAAPMVVAEGERPAALVVAQDISALKELEQLRAQWNAVIAHDLRQPINSILMRTQLLERRASKASNARPSDDEVQAIARATHRLNGMVQDLLDASRLEVRQLPLMRRQVDLVALVSERVSAARRETPTREFEFHESEAGLVAWADPDRLVQVLDNLLSNSCKYATPGSPIHVEVSRESSGALISVSNQGPGISAEELPHLFERFRRTESSVRRGIKGVGLGLYIARELAAAHGGDVTCESEPGGTTTFRVTIPLRKELSERAAPN